MATTHRLTATEAETRYDRLAAVYDALAAPYDWIGGRRLQRKAIEALDLRPGDTVVDLGTGTGWNLPLLSAAVGPDGHVIGTDLSDRMLRRAAHRVRREGLTNVDLRQQDTRDVHVSPDTRAVLSAFSMAMVAGHDDVIAGLVDQLSPGARFGLVGLREPTDWPDWLIRVNTAINGVFGFGTAYRNAQPWTALQCHAVDVHYEEGLGGTVYMAVGTAGGP